MEAGPHEPKESLDSPFIFQTSHDDRRLDLSLPSWKEKAGGEEDTSHQEQHLNQMLSLLDYSLRRVSGASDRVSVPTKTDKED